MKNFIICGFLGLTLFTSTAWAQNQLGGQSQPYAPNAYNRQSQPLSPYLNLLRGGNPAVNYFYGVRPGQQFGAFGSPFLGSTGGSGRPTFFPQIDNLYELENVNTQDGLKPTGHPFGFNNTMGYFGMSGNSTGQRNTNQPAMTPRRGSATGR
ncbi:MAG: hypothetical protein K8T89_07960 [Planctomycetes bacterium]|nr:hypothetical protein [Planctomycetota bacterium]